MFLKNEMVKFHLPQKLLCLLRGCTVYDLSAFGALHSHKYSCYGKCYETPFVA